ncbi:MAG: T9SS type A sorting domain-containing protein [Hymenobacteraceae bacterium]|nr:T9SS type A sorting domain-containing protein [Hymenobacteraceae bacterium]MDX5397560.1 T9SS type A sorting domain-containing protein [Hymenobacteraceae bacterium]MDX5513640.1 T9SS type A sorting domain-containing protein [Hymenobacteraceae bacterium]
MVKKYLIALFVTFAALQAAQAQYVVPLLHDQPRVVQAAKAGLQANKRLVSLPFFDDFAKSEGNPDSTLWLPTGGVLVSNRLAKDPVTKNVATFDGVKANGKHYDFFGNVGRVDSLVSQSINLSGFQASDSVLLSFFWQAGGIALDVPNNSNNYFLRLDFKKQNGAWTQVWKQTGNGRRTDFVQQFVAVTDPAYFHNDFQFRFIAEGGKGMVDIWNIDYVKLDRNRNRNNPFHNDVAISQSLNTLLNGYTAMPIFEFYNNPQAYLNDSVSTTINNLNNMPLPISWRGYIQSVNPVAGADTFLSGQGLIQPLEMQRVLGDAPVIPSVPLNASFLRLKYSVFLNTQEQNPLIRYNDTITRFVDINDFFAYDDGTAESGFVLPPPQSSFISIATRFVVTQPAEITALRIYLPVSNTPGTVMNFRIWGNNNGVPSSSSLHQQGVPIPPAADLGRFHEIQLSSPVTVTDTFYVGWTQGPGIVFSYVGYDLNNNTPGSVLIAPTPNNWSVYTNEEGSIMIRPVLSKIVGMEDALAAEPVKVYPNPATDRVLVSGEYEKLNLLDAAGRIVKTVNWQQSQGELHIAEVPAGLYILQVQTKQATHTKKLIITK